MVTNPVTSRLKFILTIIILLFLLFPIYWMVISSLMPNSYLFNLPPHFSPFDGSFDNYARVIVNPQYIKYFLNSFMVSGLTVVLCIVTSVLAGYSLSRFNLKIKGIFNCFYPLHSDVSYCRDSNQLIWFLQ